MSIATKWGTCVSAGAVCALLTLEAQQPPPPSERPTFRAAVSLVTVDVSVLDRDRRPVRGLTAADFEIYDDGVLRPVETLAAIDLPPTAPAPPAAWMRDVAPDVAVNTRQAGNGRLVVIVIDDGSFQQYLTADLTAIQKTRAVAREVVDQLGERDLAAVVFTSLNRTTQNFTSDRSLLFSAIDKAPLFPSPIPRPGSLPRGLGADERGDCYCGLCSIDVVRRVSESLAGVSDRRKTVFYISVGRTFEPGALEITNALRNVAAVCESRRADSFADLLRSAQAGNVTIQAIDPGGLRSQQVSSLLDYLRTVAENTGGRAVVNNNDPERTVPALFLESSSYYLLGFRPADASRGSRSRDLKVRVRRPGLQVLARTSYVPPADQAGRAPARDATLTGALAGAVPSAGLPLAVSVAPFPDGRNRAALAIVLGVTQRDSADVADVVRRGGRTATVDVLASVFSPEGKAFGSERQTLRLGINPTAADAWEYETLSRLSVPPGRYEVRVAVRTADATVASVYTYVTVPNFTADPLSLSGMVLGATPSPQTAPRDAFKDLMPLVPTARREFSGADRVTAFVRAYQRDTRTRLPATVRLRVIDATDATAFEESREVGADAFKNGSMDILLPLPFERLRPGEHLLTVSVTAGTRTETRSMRIRMK